MALSLDEIRGNAGAAIVALARRAASKGSADAKGKVKAGWIESSFDGGKVVNAEKYREAIAYYDIAASIAPEPNQSFAIYQKAILLEEMGEFAQAQQAYLSLAGMYYAASGMMGAQRCMARLQGGATAISTAPPLPPPNVSPQPQDDADRAAVVAQQFVDALLDRNYAAAQALLHSSLSALSARDLEEAFEALFENEEFPQGAQVFDVQTQWPDKTADDIAFAYVTIDSEAAEAVSVIVAREGPRLAVRGIEWGRP